MLRHKLRNITQHRQGIIHLRHFKSYNMASQFLPAQNTLPSCASAYPPASVVWSQVLNHPPFLPVSLVQDFSNSGPRVSSSVFSSFLSVSSIQSLVSGSLGLLPPYLILTSSILGIQSVPALVVSPQLVYPGFPPVVWGSSSGVSSFYGRFSNRSSSFLSFFFFLSFLGLPGVC